MSATTMNPFWRHLAVGALVSIHVLAAGCAGMQPASPPDYSGMTPAEQRLAQQTQAYNDTQLEGCLIGAGAGLLGACTIGECGLKDIAIGVALGAAVGCTAGSYLAGVQKQHGTAEAQLDAVISDVRTQNQKLVELNEGARVVVAENKTKMMQLKKDIAAGRKTREQAQQELTSQKRMEQQLQTAVAGAKEKLIATQQAASSIKASDPRQQALADQEIKQMEQQIVTLESNLEVLTETRLNVEGVG